jgi:DNA polymerase-3 subunit epsilon
MKMISFDTETTGFRCAMNGGGDEILQLAIVDEDGRTLFNRLFCPVAKRSWAQAQSVHGISPQAVEYCDPFADHRPAIQELFDEAGLLIAYNFDFDARFLQSAGISLRGKRHFDVMKEFARLHGERGLHGQRKFVKLERCAAYYGYAIEGAHDAEVDAKATMYCFQRLRQELNTARG